jgi:Flp pilus assembly protein TadG
MFIPLPALFKRFAKDESGNVLIIAGFTIILLVAIAGAGIDFGRSEIIGHKMHQAADAGALAGAGMPAGSTRADREAEVRRYFRLNFPDHYMNSDVTADDLVITASPNWRNPTTLNVQVESTIRTGFVSAVGQDTLTTNSETEVGVQNSSALDLDLVMVVDGSTSMGTNVYDGTPTRDYPSKLSLLKEAAQNLTNILLEPGRMGPNDQVRIGLVEFAGGTAPEIRQRVELTDSYRTITNAVARLNANGQTAGARGSEVGRDMLLDAPARADGHTGAIKMLIFLTDGLYNIPEHVPDSGEDLQKIGSEWPTNLGWILSKRAVARVTAACDDLADENVMVYAFYFGRDHDRETFMPGGPRSGELTIPRTQYDPVSDGMYGDLYDSLMYCASDPDSEYYMLIPTGDELIEKFASIAVRAKSLRVSK